MSRMSELHAEQEPDDQIEPCDMPTGLRMPRGVRHITVGIEDRAFGGHEEGGWYYTCFEGERVLSAPTRRRAVLERRVQRVLDRWNQGRRPIHSVLSEGRYSIRDGIINHEPTERPFYS